MGAERTSTWSPAIIGAVTAAITTLLITLLTTANTAALARQDDLDAERRDAYRGFLGMVQECSRLELETSERINGVLTGVGDGIGAITDALGGFDASGCESRLRAADGELFVIGPPQLSATASGLEGATSALRTLLIVDRTYDVIAKRHPDLTEVLDETFEGRDKEVAEALDHWISALSQFQAEAAVEIQIDDGALLAQSIRPVLSVGIVVATLVGLATVASTMLYRLLTTRSSTAGNSS